MGKRVVHALQILLFGLLLLTAGEGVCADVAARQKAATSDFTENHAIRSKQNLNDWDRIVYAVLKSDAAYGNSGQGWQRVDQPTPRTLCSQWQTAKSIADCDQQTANRFREQQCSFALNCAQQRARGHFIFSLRRIII